MPSSNACNGHKSKTSNTPDALLVTIKKSESLYISDGDVVLFSLPKDNVITAFKLDRVFLRRLSSVFEGMFALPPSEEVEYYDNVPLVRLQDEEDDLTIFLKALYDPRYIPWEKQNVNTARAAEGILLLANKYEVDHLRERIISILERDWPSDLKHWDINESEIDAKKNSFAFSPETLIPDPCEVIRLARKCDVPSILPTAFYHLSRIRGISYRRLPDPLQEAFFNKRGRETADFSLLSGDDFCCLLVGRDAMLHIFEDYVEESFRMAKECERTISADDDCRWEGLGEFQKRLRSDVIRYNSDPLSAMNKDLSPLFLTLTQTCACWGAFHHLLKEKRESFWRILPSLFMLDPEK